MTANQFRALLVRADLSQRGASRMFNVNERTVRRWALGEISVPEEIAADLTDLAAGKTTFKAIETCYARP